MAFNQDPDHPVTATTSSIANSPSLSTSYLPMPTFMNSYKSTGSSALNIQSLPTPSSVQVPSFLSSGLPNLPVENSSHSQRSFLKHSLKPTTNPSTNSASPAEPSTPSSLPMSHHLSSKSHAPAGLESRFHQERLDYLEKHVDLDNTTNSALLSFARGLAYKQPLNNVQREEFSALRERQEREMIVKAIELGVHPDSAPHYSVVQTKLNEYNIFVKYHPAAQTISQSKEFRSMRRGGDRGKMLGKKYEELKAAAIEAGEEHLFLQAEKIKAASESSFHSFKVSHADDESTARAYMQKAKREINNVSAAAHCEFVIFCVSSQARNGAFKMEASSDNASCFVNTLLTEN
ncbi:hypothetical protein BT69DRAFT_1350065 [Atractiella rhizophila]|nr:hypothetical protein BT69DRAFT_1350065 [Atractiella rhizophila]